MSREEKGVHPKRTTTDCWKSTTIARKEAKCPFAFRTFCQHLNFRLLSQRTVVLSHTQVCGNFSRQPRGTNTVPIHKLSSARVARQHCLPAILFHCLGNDHVDIILKCRLKHLRNKQKYWIKWQKSAEKFA